MYGSLISKSESLRLRHSRSATLTCLRERRAILNLRGPKTPPWLNFTWGRSSHFLFASNRFKWESISSGVPTKKGSWRGTVLGLFDGGLSRMPLASSAATCSAIRRASVPSRGWEEDEQGCFRFIMRRYIGSPSLQPAAGLGADFVFFVFVEPNENQVFSLSLFISFSADISGCVIGMFKNENPLYVHFSWNKGESHCFFASTQKESMGCVALVQFFLVQTRTTQKMECAKREKVGF